MSEHHGEWHILIHSADEFFRFMEYYNLAYGDFEGDSMHYYSYPCEIYFIGIQADNWGDEGVCITEEDLKAEIEDRKNWWSDKGY